MINMGYCWTSGKKVNGRWRFVECNGNESKHHTGSGYCYPEPSNPEKDNPRCRDCVEWCKTYKEAVAEVERYDKEHKEYLEG
jgi:hypothetical protein